ncbi:MAG: beta-galactosidase [Armatimonadota bacterium]
MPDCDPNRPLFPASSLVDYSYLLDPPAGKHGFLTVGEDGDFRFQDGTPARFWGINVAKTSVFQPKAVIRAAARAIAEAGFNLCRLHHLDDVGGLLPAEKPPNGRLSRQNLDLVDFWVSELKKRGVYVYLDLLDYRTFQPWEGVADAKELGRGAKPEALFNEKLISLQQQYALELLTVHVNPYTGLTYAQDPAVCMVELCDENGLLKRRKYLPSMSEPYAQELRRRWNYWLRATYGSNEDVRRAWGRLAPTESLEDNSIELPLGPQPAAVRRADPRRNDFLRFGYSVHRAYMRNLTQPLRQSGLRVPVSAVLDSDVMADVRAVAEELDFLATNFYWDHPFWSAGAEWQSPAFYLNLNEVEARGTQTFAPFVGISEVLGKPLVVREWNYCWPNKYRAAGILEAAAYARLLGIDAMICFTLGTPPESRRLGFFDVRRDPARWGLLGHAAKLYLSDDLRPAGRTVAVGYSLVDTFFDGLGPRLTPEGRAADDVYALGWHTAVANHFFDDAIGDTAKADLLVASGRTAAASYTGRRAVIFAGSDYTDLRGTREPGALAARAGYAVQMGLPGRYDFSLQGFLYGEGVVQERTTVRPFRLDSVRAAGHEPIGVDEASNAAWGFFDDDRSNWVFAHLAPGEAARAALDALATLYRMPVSHRSLAERVLVSGTGQLRRDEKRGILVVDAPQFQALAGALRSAPSLAATDLQLSSQTGIGAVVATSLDGRPLAASEHFAVKMVSFAINEGESKQAHGHDAAGATIYALRDHGSGPVRTMGREREEPTIVALGGRPLLHVYMANGTWELLREGDRWLLYCDTPGMRFRLPGLPDEVVVGGHTGPEEPHFRAVEQPLTHPEGVLFLEVRGAAAPR